MGNTMRDVPRMRIAMLIMKKRFATKKTNILLPQRYLSKLYHI